MPVARMQGDAESIAAAVRDAANVNRRLRIRGSGSKEFYGNRLEGELLQMSGYAGVVEYDPAELMITARAGTTLTELEDLLAASGQLLPFEPPHFGGGTLGGCIAAGLCGPRRAYAGAVRDFVLGVRIVDGRGDDLRFGGRVMKNVAGYDVSRLMVGAMGTLGVLIEVSLKVLPIKPEITLRLECDMANAMDVMSRCMARGLPVSGSCHYARQLHLRLAGSEAVLNRTRDNIGGEVIDDGPQFWCGIRDHTTEFFRSATTLWRVSVPSNAAPLNVATEQLVEWGGALRWLSGDLDPIALRSQVEAIGGHVTLFRAPSGSNVQVFHPLEPALMNVHRHLKQVFDPRGILNPHRMYDF